MNKTNVLDNLDTVKLYSTAKEVYELFQNEFSKEKLNEYLQLDDESFLRKIFPNYNKTNCDNMCYALFETKKWYEFKSGVPQKDNDVWYGGKCGYQGGLANSTGILYKDEKWKYYKGNSVVTDDIDKVAEVGRKIVETLCDLCNEVEYENFSVLIIDEYNHNNDIPNTYYTRNFIHKFFHMNYPEKFYSWHSTAKLKALMISNSLPIKSKSKYKMSKELCALNIKKDGKLILSEDVKISIAFGDIVKQKRAKNIILYGPPGTGKTYNISNLIGEIKKEDYSEYSLQEVLEKCGETAVFTTFHQSYSYEDFIIGIRPIVKDDKIAYEVKDGIFKKFCDNARNDIETPYIFIIDEINRGNISKIFGELITIIEESKRGQSVILPYEKNGEQVEFSVPKNVYIIGTMNTADRSVSMLDTALRRRFTFIEMMPNPDILDNIEAEKEIELSKLLKDMNDRIEFLYDREHTIGHAYFMNEENKTIKDLDELRFVFRYKIIPLLQEYFFDDYEKIKLVLNDDKDDDKKGFIKKIDCPESLDGNEYPSRYKISDEDWKIEDFQRIYK